jgi:cytochrome c oxidase subunit 2
MDDPTVGALPKGSQNATNHTQEIIQLWNWSWVVLLAVGILSWGLMAWAIIVYRRRKGDTGLPPQLRYNNPIETLFTIVPLILVIGFFAFTAKTMTNIEQPVKSDVHIQVIGKQWSWDFNYIDPSANVYDTGIQAQNGTEQGIPTLWLPVNKKVEIDLESRDVIHSFWVIDFLYKKDVFPGRMNKIYFTPTEVGDFKGKCAELCGEFHSAMLFNVHVASELDYQHHLDQLRAKGQTGQLPISDSRNGNLPGDNPNVRG